MKLSEPSPPLPGANEHVVKYLTCTGADSQAQGKGPPGASTDSASPAPRQKTNGSQKTRWRFFHLNQNESMKKETRICSMSM